MTFNNRTAFITGAAGRIGRAAASEFAKYGVKLILADIDMEKLDSTVTELRKITPEVYGISMDVSNQMSMEEGFNGIIERFGNVDILVNNAGVWPKGSSLETSFEEWQKVINLNLHSVFYLSKLFRQKMKEQHYGRIINLGSIAGVVGLHNFCAYSVAKAGVMMLTKTMAMELSKDNITVNSISPGMISDEKKPSKGTWLGRSGTGDEVANAILFLASDDSSYITGADIPVDGGRTLGPHTEK